MGVAREEGGVEGVTGQTGRAGGHTDQIRSVFGVLKVR